MNMIDYIHECLVCEEISYEVDENELEHGQTYKLYKCYSCGFEWEIIECGK